MAGVGLGLDLRVPHAAQGRDLAKTSVHERAPLLPLAQWTEEARGHMSPGSDGELPTRTRSRPWAPSTCHTSQQLLSPPGTCFSLPSTVASPPAFDACSGCGAWGLLSSWALLASLVAARGLSSQVACGTSVPRTVIEPVSPVVKGKFSATGPPGKSVNGMVLDKTCLTSWGLSFPVINSGIIISSF